MPTVVFGSALQRHVACPPGRVEGATVGAALDAVFASHPVLRGYVLDEHGAVRRHIAVWAGGAPLQDRVGLTDAVGPDDEVYVMQALSGG